MLGLRWDYLPPYHEVQNRWSFLNPNITNPATGSPGALQFAGNYGGAGVSCGCRTPVPTYWNNWGPRVGITYQTDSKDRLPCWHRPCLLARRRRRRSWWRLQRHRPARLQHHGHSPCRSHNWRHSRTVLLPQQQRLLPVDRDVNTALGFTYPAAPTPSAASQILQHRPLRQSGHRQIRHAVDHLLCRSPLLRPCAGLHVLQRWLRARSDQQHDVCPQLRWQSEPPPDQLHQHRDRNGPWLLVQSVESDLPGRTRRGDRFDWQAAAANCPGKRVERCQGE